MPQDTNQEPDSMKSEDVAAFLKRNPAFFTEYGEMLADLEVDSGAPFHQRQIEVLRKRNDQEKERYEMVVESARNNQALEKSVHEFACNLLSCDSAMTDAIVEYLKTGFGVDGARICEPGDDAVDAGEFELMAQRVRHGSSICDDRVSTTLLNALFGADHGIRSCAFVPLRRGVMVLGSRDVEKFVPGMGPIYLDRVGELVSALQSRGAG